MADSSRNGSFGRPGTSPNAPSTPAPMNSGRGLREHLRGDVGAEVRVASVAARVTMMPVAVEISSAGICAARPSPIDSSEKVYSGVAEAHALLQDADDDAARGC